MYPGKVKRSAPKSEAIDEDSLQFNYGFGSESALAAMALGASVAG
jgi:hypothetical protein